MNDRRTITTVSYQVKPDRAGSLTLQDVSEFACTLERLGEGRLLTSQLMGNLREGVYVTSVVRVPDEKPVPASDELLAENEALHYRLDRIRQHHDDCRHAKIGLQVMRDLIEQELQAHPPAVAGITWSQRQMVALYLEQWRGGEVGAVTALQNISGLLGLNPLAADDGDED